MKNMLVPILVIAATTLGASGCDDLTTPQGVLTFANGAVQADDPKLLRTVLVDDAAARLESHHGYAEFRYQLHGQDVLLGKPTEMHYVGYPDYSVTLYKADVLSKTRGEYLYRHVFTVTVRCHRSKGRANEDKCLIVNIEDSGLIGPDKYVEYGGR